MNYGIVDIGSNTIRCNVYHIENGDFSLLFSKKHTAGLASYVEGGRLSRKGIEKLIRILKSIRLMTDQVDLDELFLFATASLRKVSNSEEVIREVHEKLGLSIELLSEKEEATLGFLGITRMISDDGGVSCDIGGGSTEVVLFSEDQVQDVINLDEGSLSLFTKFNERIIPTKKEIKAMRKYIRKKLKVYDEVPEYPLLVGIGGSVRAANNVIQEIYGVPKEKPFTVDTAKDLLKRFKDQDRDTIRMVLKVSPERIHTFAPGLCILLEVCRHFSVKEVQVCKSGLREGYLMHKMEMLE